MSINRTIFWRLFFLVAFCSLLFSAIYIYVYKPYNSKNVVVSFGEYSLSKSDLEGLNQDQCVDYINDWLVTHYLQDTFDNEAEEALRTEIDKKVASYKSKLCAHMQLDSLMAKRIALTVSDQEIDLFYKANQKYFLLQDHIFRGIYIIIPKSLKENSFIKTLLEQGGKDIETLKKYCFLAKKYIIDDNIWLAWNKELENTPYANQDIKNIGEKKLYVFYDKTYAYYLWVTELKKSGDIAPLFIVKDKVRQRLVLSKKLELEKKIMRESLNELKQNKKYKSYEE